MASAPAWLTAAAHSARPPVLVSTRTSRAPSVARRVAVARPMPPAAPVIRTTLPSNRDAIARFLLEAGLVAGGQLDERRLERVGLGVRRVAPDQDVRGR